MATSLSDAYDHFLAIVQGRNIRSPINSKEIEQLLEISGTEVRDYVRKARHLGIPIASCKHGYFLAKTAEEYEDSINDLQARANSLLRTVSLMKQTFSPQETLF